MAAGRSTGVRPHRRLAALLRSYTASRLGGCLASKARWVVAARHINRNWPGNRRVSSSVALPSTPMQRESKLSVTGIKLSQKAPQHRDHGSARCKLSVSAVRNRRKSQTLPQPAATGRGRVFENSSHKRHRLCQADCNPLGGLKDDGGHVRQGARSGTSEDFCYSSQNR